jgi:hypothetical protein
MANSNSPFSTGSSVSSLLRSAQSTQQKVNDFNDALTAYQWENSAKSYEDYLAYNDYLASQQRNTTDPSAQLGYQKKLDSARSGYISNEVQRQSIDVIEGATSNVDKYNRMLGLYYTAANSGQFDLAQNLHLQLDNLSVTIQNDQRASLQANKEALRQATENIDNQVQDAVTQIKDNATYALEQYQTLGPEKFQEATGSDIFSMLSNMVNSQDPNNPGLVQVYDQAQRASPDPSKVRQYQVQLNDFATGGKTGFQLPGVGDVTYKDLQDQAYAQSIGQTLFDTVDTGKGVQFTKNETTGYAWGRDENGNYQLMPIYNPKQNFTSDVANPKKKNETLTFDKVLSSAGFDVLSSGSKLIVRNNGEFDNAGVPRGQQVQLYVDANGKLQVVNGNKAYSLNFDQQTGKYLGLNAQTPNAINLLPSGNERLSRFNNRFLSTQDLSNLPAGAIGLVDTTSPIARSMEAGPLAQPQPQLQQAGGIQQVAGVGQIQPTAPSPVLQSAASPIGLPANMTINLAKPQPLPTITLAKPKPLPTLTVTQAKPQPSLAVGNAQPSARIAF